jgi:hypothetical protein
VNVIPVVGNRAVLLVAVGFLVAGCGGQRPSSADSQSTTGAAESWKSVPTGWSSLPKPPFARARAVSVWTGRELFYWGGDTDHGGVGHADGAAYDPASRTWHRLPSGPLSGRSSAAAVWTGKEVLIWGGGRDGGDLNDGAAFDPAGGEWRALAPSPLSPRTPVASVWTGSEMVVWGDDSRSAGDPHHEGAAYDPAADRWRQLPSAPLELNQAGAIWTGEEMIVFGSRLDGNNRADTEHAQGMAYDPEANVWRVIAGYPLSPQASTVLWTGKEMIAWDYELEAGAYDPAGDTWRRLPDLPLRFYECYPQSARVDEVVVAWHCGLGATLDSTGAWRRMPRVAAGTLIYGRPVSAGGVVLFAGAAHEGHADALWAFKPATRAG